MKKARVIKVEGYVSIERLIDGDWIEDIRFTEDVSIEQGRAHLERLTPALSEVEHRLTFTRIETTKEIVT